MLHIRLKVLQAIVERLRNLLYFVGCLLLNEVDVKVFKDVSKEVEKLKPTRGLFWTCYHRTFGALFTKLGLASLSSVTFDKRRILFNVSGKFQAGELSTW